MARKKLWKKLKSAILRSSPMGELRGQKRLSKDVELDSALSKAAAILEYNMDHHRQSGRIAQSVKIDGDLLIDIAWQSGAATNRQIGNRLGLSCSAVSRRVKVIKAVLNDDSQLDRNYRPIKPLIKI